MSARGMSRDDFAFATVSPEKTCRQCPHMRARVFLGIAMCLALLAAPPSPAQKLSRLTTVRMEEDNDHKMVGVPCQVNGGRHRYVCVIDSGATNTIISDRLVKAEGPVIEMTTGNGTVRVHQRELSLTLADGLELKTKALVQSMMLTGVDILVGQDVLRQFRFVIFDFEGRQVEFQW
jgi:gag-polyprotein putative aspartyl protease